MEAEQLALMHAACRNGQLCWSVHYCEPEDTWELEISGPARAECFYIKRASTLNDGLRRCLEHLSKIGYYNGS